MTLQNPLAGITPEHARDSKLAQQGAKVGGAIPMHLLSKAAKAVFERWPEYLEALGTKPSAFYVTRKQKDTLDKSLRRIDGNLSCTDFKFDGLPIKVYQP